MSLRFLVVLFATSCAAPIFADFRDGFQQTTPTFIARPRPPKEALIPLSPNEIVGRVLYKTDDGKIAIVQIERGIIYRDTVLVARDHNCRSKAVLRPIPGDKPSTIVAVAIDGGSVNKGDEVVIPGPTLEKQAKAQWTPVVSKPEPTSPADATNSPGNPPSPASGR